MRARENSIPRPRVEKNADVHLISCTCTQNESSGQEHDFKKNNTKN